MDIKLFSGPISFLKSAPDLQFLPEPTVPEIAFAGRSNVGKSSLINALTNQSGLARASAEPGRTRELNYFDVGNGALFLVDMAHFAGLVAGGQHPNPLDHAHIATTTTHKTLRGPRGGLILCKEEFAKKIDSQVFPGTQGGPLMHVIAAKAVAFKEALSAEFVAYQQQVVANARAMAGVFIERGYDIVSGGTDNHLFLVSLIAKGLTGKAADAALGRAWITVNKNAVPNDPQSPFVTSGIRIGSPAITTRGFQERECRELTGWICDILDDLGNEAVIERVRSQVQALCARFPVYG